MPVMYNTPQGCREAGTFTPLQPFWTGKGWFTGGKFGTGIIPVPKYGSFCRST